MRTIIAALLFTAAAPALAGPAEDFKALQDDYWNAYLKDNPHLVVSLLYLDVDLYEPTKIAIETFLPRMPRGAVIAFDELNARIFPGETIAVAETLGIRNIRIERFPFDSYVSFAVLE